MEQYAFLDALTHVANRRRFDQTLSAEWAHAIDNGDPLGLCLIDVDDFKNYNDNFGHSAGDRCLQLIALNLQNSVSRPGDLVARFGGEEFVLLMPGADELTTHSIAEHARATVEALRIPHPFNRGSAVVSVSIGYTSCRPDGSLEKPQRLVEIADQALYHAKAHGRNCIRHEGCLGRAQGSASNG